MSALNILAGQLVKFDDGGALLSSYQYYLAEDVSLTLSSSFKPLVDGGSPSLFKMIAGVSNSLFNVSFSGEYKELGFVIWDRTEPVQVSFSVDLVMSTNARVDVFDPLQALIKLPLPEDRGFPQGLVPPGPSILELLGKHDTNIGGQYLTIYLGGVVMRRAILTSAVPTICRYTDDKDCPIYAKVSCTAQSSTIATKQLVDEMFTRG